MDRETLEGFRLGDETAVKAVYSRFSRPVFSIALNILRDRDLAADATQQTFVKAWQAADTLDPGRDPGPWIYTIARRTAIDMYRKQTRSVVRDDIDLAQPGPSLDRIWEVFEVRNALEQLPEEEREVIRMSHLEGLTHTEIAETLDIPVGTVKSRSHRGHQRLIDLLTHLGENE